MTKQEQLRYEYFIETGALWMDENNVIDIDYVNWLETKQLTLGVVSQQRELLQAFQEKYNEENTDEDVQIYDHHIDDFLNSL